MSRNLHIFLFLVLTLVGCSRDEPGHIWSFVDAREFIRLTKSDANEMKQRYYLRELYRELGVQRFCEEGEWPQRWVEHCNTCWCEHGEVRRCTDRLCRYENPWPYRHMCAPPVDQRPPDTPKNQCIGPAALGPPVECYGYWEGEP